MSKEVDNPQMGRYCKAYLAKRFRQFPGWKENLQNLRVDVKTEEKEGEQASQRTEIQDDDVLYLQENYVVTDYVFKDKYIIFDQVSEEWKAFCNDTLGFEIPTFVDPKDVVLKEDAEGAKNG